MISFAKLVSRVGNIAIVIGIIAFVLQVTIPVVSPHILLIAIFTIVATTVELVYGSNPKSKQRA